MIRKCYKFYTLIMTLMWVMAAMTASAFAVAVSYTHLTLPTNSRV